jgi:ADP-heptose:LPS heptosyltransferase
VEAVRSARTSSPPASRAAVLFVRPDHLGDLVLTLPAACYLKRAVPSARLTYLVSRSLVDIPTRCPAVDSTIGLPFPDPRVQYLDESLWREAVAAGPPLSRHDVALLLRPNDPVGGAIAARLEIPTRIGFPQPGTRPFLTNVVTEPRGHHATLGFRLVDELLRQLGHPPPRDGARDWDAVVDDAATAEMLVERPEDAREAAAVLVSVQHVTGSVPLVMHPGSGWILKNWGPERWGQLARATFERYGRAPLLTGTAAESDLCDAVIAHAGGRAVSAAGRLGLGGFAALLRRSRAVVAVDSGPLHLAALVRCPVVGLYGPVNEESAGPLIEASRRRTLGVELPCRPCGQMVHPPCGATRDPECITRIQLNDVVASLDAVVGATSLPA